MVGRIGVMAACLSAALLVAAPSPPARAASALFMGGTFDQLRVPDDTPDLISSYISNMGSRYLDPTGLCAGGEPGCSPLAVYTPEEIKGVTGWRDLSFDDSVQAGVQNLDSCLRAVPCVVTPPPYTTTETTALTDTVYTVLGYSQSATVATVEKAALIAQPPAASVGFVLFANPNRPNGGILQRFAGAYLPVLGVTFNGATPTDSPQSAPLTTVDITGQYDPISDFPTNPLNLLADLNTLFGFYLVHLRAFDLGTPELQGQYGDSAYYLIPAETLPLLAPIAAIPKIGPLLATILDPPLRVAIEAGYDRTVNPGSPTRARLLYFPSPITTAVNVMKAIPTGWDNGIAYASGDPNNRPFRTSVPGPYGVGGPPLDNSRPASASPDQRQAVPRHLGQSVLHESVDPLGVGVGVLSGADDSRRQDPGVQLGGKRQVRDHSDRTGVQSPRQRQARR